MTRSGSRYLKASVLAAVAALGVLTAGSDAFSHDEHSPSVSERADALRSAAPVVGLYLRIEGVEGDSRDMGRSGWIDIDSFSWGGTAGGGSTDGRSLANLSHLSVSARTGKASAKLAEALAKGLPIASATLSVVRLGIDKPTEYLTYTFGNVVISSFQMAGSEGVPSTTESFSLSYNVLDIAYREQKADGSWGATITARVAGQ